MIEYASICLFYEKNTEHQRISLITKNDENRNVMR